MFSDTMMTVALGDRLIHHAYILNMNRESYRLKDKIKKKGSILDNTGTETEVVRKVNKDLKKTIRVYDYHF